MKTLCTITPDMQSSALDWSVRKVHLFIFSKFIIKICLCHIDGFLMENSMNKYYQVYWNTKMEVDDSLTKTKQKKNY